jgi:hypothetical protein
LVVFALEFLDKMVDEMIIEILSTKMSVTSGSLYFKDALLSSRRLVDDSVVVVVV